MKLDKEEMPCWSHSGEEDNSKKLLAQLIFEDGDGNFTKGDLINLGSWDTGSASFNRPVLESLHPSTYGIQSAEFIL